VETRHAEAEVTFDRVFEMEDINGESGQADVAIILGANEVLNAAARMKGSAIYGMASGYAGLDNELVSMDKTIMVFGDAKKVVDGMVKAVA
jgi:NAD(P) transhydrogenase subunit beta